MPTAQVHFCNTICIDILYPLGLSRNTVQQECTLQYTSSEVISKLGIRRPVLRSFYTSTKPQTSKHTEETLLHKKYFQFLSNSRKPENGEVEKFKK